MSKTRSPDSRKRPIIVVEDTGQELARPEWFRKHVALVHAFAELTLVQRKVVNVLLHHSSRNRSGNPQHWYSISLHDIRDAIGYSGRNWAWLRDSIRSLKGVSLEYDILGDGAVLGEAGSDSGDQNEVLYMACVPFINVNVYRSGEIRYQLNPSVADDLLNPEIYGLLNMDLQKKFRTRWGHALYENVARFAPFGTTQMRPYETWRRLLGVKQGTYTDWAKFRKNVLEPAIWDVHENTDFQLEVIVRRSGKRYSAFEILIRTPDAPGHELSATQKRLLDALCAKGVVRRVAASIVASHDEAHIRAALDELNHRSRQTELRNPGGWFVARLGAIVEKSRKSPPREDPAEVKGSALKADHAPSLPSIQDIANTFGVCIEDVWEDFERSLGPGEKMLYRRSGAEHPAIRAAFHRYLESGQEA